MLISEIYQSRQGEGLLTGRDSIFVRTSGCNLRCWFCDTPFTSWRPEGENLGIADILGKIEGFSCQSVVITGGEPMLQKQIVELTHAISDDIHITIETAGTIHHNVRCDLMSISPKMANSTPSVEKAGDWAQRHQLTRFQPTVVQQLIDEYEYQLKFVVDHKDDIVEITEYLAQFNGIDQKRVLFMPQGTQLDELNERGKWLKQECDVQGFTYCPRMHIEWYGNKRGT